MLYFIATPIGNLNDISLRSIDLLKNTNYIFAEDTRNTKKLLDFLDIKKKVQSFHEHNEKDITPKILSILKDKSDVVIVSDAGTPAISDPGYYLLTQCIKNEITFTALPGPSSVINALLLSGMPPSSFLFLGFIPKKGKPKHNFLESIAKTQHTTILFETARRIENTISILNTLYRYKVLRIDIVFSILLAVSNKIVVCWVLAIDSRKLCLGLPFFGINPKNRKLDGGMPDNSKALITLDGPGNAVKVISFFIHCVSK